MMSTIAGEGTNSDGREVTTTVQEREKIDAEMTGTTGKKRMWGSSALFVKLDSVKHSTVSSSPAKCIYNVAPWSSFTERIWDWGLIFVSCTCFFPVSCFPGSGTEAGNGVAAESTGIMTEVVGRDSPRRGTTWVPSRNAWEETGEISSNTNAQFLHLLPAVA